MDKMDNTKKCRDTIKNASIFHCELCNFTSSKESNYQKHLSTRKHKRIILDNKNAKKNAKNAKKNAKTFDYTIDVTTPPDHPINISTAFICLCGKSYKYQSGLCKHKHKCKILQLTLENENNTNDNSDINNTSDISYVIHNNNNNNANAIVSGDNVKSNTFNKTTKKNKYNKTNTKNNDDVDDNNYKSMFMELINQNKELVKNVMGENKQLHNIIKKQQDTFNQQMSEILPKVGNTIHQNNSIHNANKYNIFLNDKCKDALDIKEFLESLIIEVADLEYTGREGFVKGISNIFIRGLKELEVTKRPIHCTDLKRDTLYIKDQGKWEKDNNEEKVLHAIDTVKQNTFSKIQSWTKSHPKYVDQNHPHSDEYLKLVRNSIGGYDETLNKNVKKVIKKLANEVYLPANDLSNTIMS